MTTETATAKRDWTDKSEWILRGTNFAVMVVRHDRGFSVHDGGNNGWCVYVSIYPKHPLFAAINNGKTKDWEIPAIQNMPLHGGCTFFERCRHTEDADGQYGRNWKMGDICAFKIGCDYQHLHDYYGDCVTKQDAYTIFQDAEELFDHVTRLGGVSEEAVPA